MNRELDPNRAILRMVAQALGDLREHLVFVGGCATGLLMSVMRADVIRPTEDVDLVAQVTTTQAYHQFESQLRQLGFVQDMTADAPICRWRFDGVAVDFMPSESHILGFFNRWYPLAVITAQSVSLDQGITIRLIAAPVFIATKLEAFAGRGKGDFLMSHDLEDIVTVVDGRPELLDEIKVSDPELRQYLVATFKALNMQDDFITAIQGYLPGDIASQARLGGLVQRLHAIAGLE
jgi:predicted nucleotidyltransferase